MQVSDNLYELHKALEGYRHKPYLDSGGVLTIGVGHAAQSIEPFDEDSEWDDAKIREVWEKDIASASAKVDEYTKGITLTQGWYDALVDLVFNTGVKPKTLIAKLHANSIDEARDEFLRWVYDNGVVQLGLIKRRFADYVLTLDEDPYEILNVPLRKGYLGQFNKVIKKYGYAIEPTTNKARYFIVEA